MATEIERKFLVTNSDWTKSAVLDGNIQQGYLNDDKKRSVRIRTIENDPWNAAYITIKGETVGISRPEYEYEIPLEDAEGLLKIAVSSISKTRYVVTVDNKYWEVDVFHGKNEGLVLAEIELESEDEEIEIPDWVGKEVSDDSRYYNMSLSVNSLNETKGDIT